MNLERGVGVIVQNKKGEFLLHLRDEKTSVMANQWCLIGGSVEKNEIPETAAKRELKEETNIESEKIKLFKKFIFNNKEINIFFAKVNRQNEKIKLGEGKKIQFFNKNDLIYLIKNLNYTNPYLEAIEEFLKKQKSSE